MINTSAIHFPNQFQRESLDLIHRLLPLSSSGFYLVGPDMRHSGVVLRNLEPDAERDYTQHYQQSDPLNPRHFRYSELGVACLDEVIDEGTLLSSDYYRGFMQPLGHRHVSDMFFRREGDIIAVLTMLRSAALGPFSAGELRVLRSLQPFLEYTLNLVYIPERHRQRETIQERYALTARELDVIELVVSGASNKLIARELALSLATVKTHLQHIFQKMAVSSRTALSARVLGELSGGDEPGAHTSG
jgi:DNA-binding CsgD family transcriptional regulator